MGASFSVVRVQFYCLVEVLYGSLVLAQAMVGNPPVAVGPGVVGVQLDGFVVVRYGPPVRCGTVRYGPPPWSAVRSAAL